MRTRRESCSKNRFARLKKRKIAAKVPLGIPKKSRVADLLSSPRGSDQEDPEVKVEEVIDFADSEGQDLDVAQKGVPNLPGEDVHSPMSLCQEDPSRTPKKSRLGQLEEDELDLLSPTVGVTLAQATPFEPLHFVDKEKLMLNQISTFFKKLREW